MLDHHTRTRTSRILATVGAAAVVVGAANLGAYAADGHPLLLGHANDESQTATVVNHGPGPALSIGTRDDTAPFEVSSAAKVRRLNADRVDGINGGEVTAYTYRLHSVFSAARFAQRFPGLPAGRDYLVSYWLDADMTVSTDDLFCEIEATKLKGDPATDEIATSISTRDFLVSATSSALVTTRNHSLDLFCDTGTDTATIDSLDDGSVTFVPIGRSHVATAKPIPPI